MSAIIKISFLAVLLIMMTEQIAFPQSKDSSSQRNDSLQQKSNRKGKKENVKKDKESSFMDKIQRIIELRRSFDIADEITKPALLSFKKDDDERAIFLIHVALAYKGFRFDKTGVTPSIQFDYSSKEKDLLEKVRLGFDLYSRVYEYSGGSGKIQPFLAFGRDFASRIDEFKFNLSFVPSFPKFFIPVRNISNIKFRYDGIDNQWVFGINPIIGATYERSYGGLNHFDRTDYYSLTAASITVKKYYFQFDLFGKYEKEFIDEHDIRYKYEATATIYFDEKERSSINGKFEQEEKDRIVKRRMTVGFGIKL